MAQSMLKERSQGGQTNIMSKTQWQSQNKRHGMTYKNSKGDLPHGILIKNKRE